MALFNLLVLKNLKIQQSKTWLVVYYHIFHLIVFYVHVIFSA